MSCNRHDQPTLPGIEEPIEYPTLIGLYGHAQAGKSVVANTLVNRHDYTLVKLAGPLKSMIQGLLWEVGVPMEQTKRMLEGDLKSAVVDQLGFTPRHLMQTLGTQWGRDTLDPDFWLDIFSVRVSRLRDQGKRVVCDDMRFANEKGLVERLGGNCWHIVRPRTNEEAVSQHASEGALDWVECWDEVIFNNSTVPVLRDRVAGILNA
ncbi:deoxynucleotide monophosphate kinase family protein [Pyruvatibacter sp.]